MQVTEVWGLWGSGLSTIHLGWGPGPVQWGLTQHMVLGLAHGPSLSIPGLTWVGLGPQPQTSQVSAWLERRLFQKFANLVWEMQGWEGGRGVATLIAMAPKVGNTLMEWGLVLLSRSPAILCTAKETTASNIFQVYGNPFSLTHLNFPFCFWGERIGFMQENMPCNFLSTLWAHLCMQMLLDGFTLE